MIGLNHKTAPVRVRERAAVGPEALPAALDALRTAPGIQEAAIVSTCNRTELYVVSDDGDLGRNSLLEFMTKVTSMPKGELEPHLFEYDDQDAAAHLFKVASGLDSMVLGETQILGQVRDGYLAAAEHGAVGKQLHQLFGQALAVGKRAQTETHVGQSAVSVSYVAVELAKRVYQSLAGKRALCIGAGETAELTVRHLQAAGVTDFVVCNRTLARAEELAEKVGGTALPLDQMVRALHDVDVVVSSTASPGVVLSREHVVEAVRHRRGRPMFLFDLAIPRDIDPDVGKLDGVFLYDLDDLQQAVAHNLQERAREARKVEKIVAEETAKFMQWQESQAVVPTIRMLRAKMEAIRQEELAKTMSRLPDLTDRERQIIEAMTVTMLNKMLNDPTQRLKLLAGGGQTAAAVKMVNELFALDAYQPDELKAR